jgi:hypothetical protein
VDQQVFQSCIAWKLPKLFSVFKSTSTLLEPIICPWFLCLYINVLPLSVVCRVWDCMFWEGSVVLFRIGLTLMKSKSKYIIAANDFVSIYTILKVSNSKTYSFELECRDKDAASPGSPIGGVSPPPLGGLDVLQDLGNISRAEFLINSAFGFRWLKSVPKEQVEVLRKKFLALLESDRAERLVSTGSSHGTPLDALKSGSSPAASSLTSRFSGLFRTSSSQAMGGDSSSPSTSAPGSPMSPSKTPMAGVDDKAAEKAELAATISKHQSTQNKSHGSTQRGARSRQSMAMLKLLEELE